MKSSLLLCLYLLLSAGPLNAATISTMNITGGDFLLGTFTPYPNPMVVGSTGSTNIIGHAAAATWDVNTIQNGMVSEIGGFNLNDSNTWINIFLNHSSTQNVDVGGHAAPHGDATLGGTIAVDLGSWYWNWNGQDYNLGGIATGTVDAFGNYDIGWDAVFDGGPFNGGTVQWHLTGQVTTVPVPAGIWLFATGVLGLSWSIRKNNRTNVRVKGNLDR